jgi:hypothetical protein
MTKNSERILKEKIEKEKLRQIKEEGQEEFDLWPAH